MKVAIAGCSGALGGELVRQAAAAGHHVTGLSRRKAAPKIEASINRRAFVDINDGVALALVLDDVDAVITAVGAPVGLRLTPRRGFFLTDTAPNLSLLHAAERAGVKRFVYVSCFGHEALKECAYVDAHEGVVDEMNKSDMVTTVIRPTGFYSALAVLQHVAAMRIMPRLGTGEVKTNPIGDSDLAAFIIERGLSAAGPHSGHSVGGPEVLTRKQISHIAYAARHGPGRRPFEIPVPGGGSA